VQLSVPDRNPFRCIAEDSSQPADVERLNRMLATAPPITGEELRELVLEKWGRRWAGFITERRPAWLYVMSIVEAGQTLHLTKPSPDKCSYDVRLQKRGSRMYIHVMWRFLEQQVCVCTVRRICRRDLERAFSSSPTSVLPL
jgi:hypothetical protein